MIDPSLDAFCSEVQLRNSRIQGNSCPWCNGKEYSHKSTFLCIHREILDFVRWIEPTESEKHLRFLVVRRFRSAISCLWPSAKVICHGSTATGTFLPNGDLDFCVVGLPEGDTEALLEQLCEHLLNLQVVSRAQVIKAKCPIVKAVEKPFGYHIDISVNNENGILNIKRNICLMKTYKQLYPLIMVLKVFLYQEELDEPFKGGISSNTLIQLIVFVIQYAREDSQKNLGRLLMSFFNIFGKTFNYFTTGISTREGGALFSRIETARLQFKTPVTLCVEDPQIPGQFLGENAFATPKFRTACQEAFRKMNTSNGAEQSILLRFLDFPKQLEHIRNDLNKNYQSLMGTLRDGFQLSLTPSRRDRERSYNNRDKDRNYNRDRNPNQYYDRDPRNPNQYYDRDPRRDNHQMGRSRSYEGKFGANPRYDRNDRYDPRRNGKW